ncbi:hypothetical protein [Deinococcus aetherius]|uniref:hypothetical protein n=1 Tax=Deinococcus aetherius TaxID=200252 RepID=UPI002230FE29|nr:hypothetical protein [Deinococcus aetherius]
MSRAFVKEDGGERWMPPATPHAYRVLWQGTRGPEVVHESDDLLAALRWLSGRPQGDFELRDHAGALLATA